MANDRIETALAAVLEELEQLRKREEEQTKLLKEVMEKMEGIDEAGKETRQALLKPLNTAPLEVAIAKGMTRLQQTVEAQPKAVINERRILLFPEYNAGEYYKTVIARLSFAVIAVIIATFLFLLSEQLIKGWYSVHSQENKVNAYEGAWQRLYKESGTQEKKKMDDIANGK